MILCFLRFKKHSIVNDLSELLKSNNSEVSSQSSFAGIFRHSKFQVAREPSTNLLVSLGP